MKAAILDLDGVIVGTAKLHAEAWKCAFDEYLKERASSQERGGPYKPFSIQDDYLRYVDGKAREDGIRSFLQSRCIIEPKDGIARIGARKNEIYLGLLAERRPEIFEDALRAVQKWKRRGIKTGVASSSRNCSAVLKAAGLTGLFDVQVDGTDLDRENLQGKPQPDLFLAAARALDIEPTDAVVFEDAIAGIEAAKRGGFQRAIGVARDKPGDDLHQAGADQVIRSFDEFSEPNWKLRYKSWSPKGQSLREALCTLGNGFFATRGAAEEASAGEVHYPGTYLAGGYNRLRTEISGLTVENEDFVNWPNWLCLSFKCERGEWLDLQKMAVREFVQDLDLESGVLFRRFIVRDSGGRETRLISRRIVSMADPHLAAIEWELTPRNWDGAITVRSSLDGTVVNQGVKRYEALNHRHLNVLDSGGFSTGADESSIYLLVETNQSKIRMAQTARTRFFDETNPIRTQCRQKSNGGLISQEHAFSVRRGHPIRIEKVVGLYTSRDHAISEPLEAAKTASVRAEPFAELLKKHALRWSITWRRADMQLGEKSEMQLALRLHIFHLLQTVSLASVDRDIGVPARGLHGEAYRGHVFWDELFIFPFFNFRLPELSREFLEYRYRRLGEARIMAKEAGYRGAMFPWQSGSRGSEESPMAHLNPVSGRWIPDLTHHQRHVNSAIAYNIWSYYQVTKDRDFISFYGAEMMLEIARFWASRAEFNPERGRYEIRGVVGPDEFHTQYPGRAEVGIDNNAYTNVMASWCIEKAVHLLHAMSEERRIELMEELGITRDELDTWKDVSRRLYVPMRDGIILQFDGYEKLKDLDLEAYREKYGDVQRLDRILEAEGKATNDYTVLKQADVLMLFYLFSVEELSHIFERLNYPFNPSMIAKNIEYYLRHTAHGSTLSRVIHSWVLSRADRQGSWGLFEAALKSDLADIQGGTTKEGIHLGAMAETIDMIQRCYTGMEPRDEVLWFNPRLPDELPSLQFRIKYRGHWLSISITHTRFEIKADRSWHEAAKIGFQGKVYVIEEGDQKEFRLERYPKEAAARA